MYLRRVVGGEGVNSMSAPCEACPPCCRQCAWDRTPVSPASGAKRQLAVIRSSEAYGCVREDASIVVDRSERKPFMRIGDDLLPLSRAFGDVIRGSRLEADIAAALS